MPLFETRPGRQLGIPRLAIAIRSLLRRSIRCGRDAVVAVDVVGNGEVRVGAKQGDVVLEAHLAKDRGATFAEVARAGGKWREDQAGALAEAVGCDVRVELGANGVRAR